MGTMLEHFFNYLPYIIVMGGWIYAIFLIARKQNPKLVYLLRILFLLLLAIAIGVSIFYIHKSYLDNGSDCTFDNFACQANDDFLTGVFGWGLAISCPLFFMNMTLWILAKRKANGYTSRKKIVK
jgi:hypothetical protein